MPYVPYNTYQVIKRENRFGMVKPLDVCLSAVGFKMAGSDQDGWARAEEMADMLEDREHERQLIVEMNTARKQELMEEGMSESEADAVIRSEMVEHTEKRVTITRTTQNRDTCSPSLKPLHSGHAHQ